MTVTANAQSKTYGDADPTLTYTGALNTGDSFTGALTRAAGENVGVYAISQGTLAAGSNYALTFVGANLTVTAKAVTVTADAQSKTYGDADPTLTYTGALNSGDSFTGALTRAAGENVGVYAISQGTLAAGSNYALTFVGANLTVTAKAVTVTADRQEQDLRRRRPDPHLHRRAEQRRQLHGRPDAGGRGERRGLRHQPGHPGGGQQLRADLCRRQPDGRRPRR